MIVLPPHKNDRKIQNQKVSTIEEDIQKLNKISHIPNLFASIIILLIFPLIYFFYPEFLHEYIFSYLFLSIISLMIYYYDSHVISPKIKAGEYEDVYFDTLIWGILGCILYGIGILILFKSFLILGQFFNERDSKKIKEDEQNLINITCLKLFNSLKRCSIKVGIFIIFLVFYNVGLEFFENLFLNLKNGEFFYFLNPFIIFLVISIIVLYTESKWEEKIKDQHFLDDFKYWKRFVKSILGCLFYFAGLFILFKILLEILCNYYEIDIRETNNKLEEKIEKIERYIFLELSENKSFSSNQIKKFNSPQVKNPAIYFETSEAKKRDQEKDISVVNISIVNKEPLEKKQPSQNDITEFINHSNQFNKEIISKNISIMEPRLTIPKIYIPEIKVHVPKIYKRKTKEE